MSANDVSSKQESSDFTEYLDELRRRLPEYARRAAAVSPEAKGSIEWLARIGKFWWEAREREGLSRYQVAEKLDVPVNSVRFLELGIASLDEVANLPPKYATALGRPELYSRFIEQFEIDYVGQSL